MEYKKSVIILLLAVFLTIQIVNSEDWFRYGSDHQVSFVYDSDYRGDFASDKDVSESTNQQEKVSLYSPLIADLDGDGRREIIVVKDQEIRLYTGSDYELVDVEYFSWLRPIGQMAVTDFITGGNRELVMVVDIDGTNTTFSLRVLNWDGTDFTLTKYIDGVEKSNSINCRDIDADGKIECMYFSDLGYLYAYDEDDTSPVSYSAATGQYGGPCSYYSIPHFIDYDGDGDDDIFVMWRNTSNSRCGTVKKIRNDGGESFSLIYKYGFPDTEEVNQIAMIDLDGGQKEIVITASKTFAHAFSSGSDNSGLYIFGANDNLLKCRRTFHQSRHNPPIAGLHTCYGQEGTLACDYDSDSYDEIWVFAPSIHEDYDNRIMVIDYDCSVLQTYNIPWNPITGVSCGVYDGSGYIDTYAHSQAVWANLDDDDEFEILYDGHIIDKDGTIVKKLYGSLGMSGPVCFNTYNIVAEVTGDTINDVVYQVDDEIHVYSSIPSTITGYTCDETPIITDSFDYSDNFTNHGWTYSSAYPSQPNDYDYPLTSPFTTNAYAYDGYNPITGYTRYIIRSFTPTSDKLVLNYDVEIGSSAQPLTVLISGGGSSLSIVHNSEDIETSSALSGFESCTITTPVSNNFNIIIELDLPGNRYNLYVDVDSNNECHNKILQTSGSWNVNAIGFYNNVAYQSTTKMYTDNIEFCEGHLNYAGIGCSDSDGGVDYLTKGYTTDSGGTTWDYCVSNTLKEQYCFGGYGYDIDKDCKDYGSEYVCDDGKCVEGNLTCSSPLAYQGQYWCTSGYVYYCDPPGGINGWDNYDICGLAGSNETGNCVVEGSINDTSEGICELAECYDADGTNYLYKSYVNYDDVTYWDFCYDASSLNEYTCTGGLLSNTTKACTDYGSEYMCDGGKCTLAPINCTDSDGTNYFNKGWVYDGPTNNTYWDACENDITLWEKICGPSGIDIIEKSCAFFGPLYMCYDGSCIEQPVNCTDSDGVDYWTKGYVTDIITETIYWDFCFDDTKVSEFICSGEEVSSVIENCQDWISTDVCSDGKCTSFVNCTDSDGGFDYYVKGTVTTTSGTYTDYCVSVRGNDNYVAEYYCDDDGGLGLISNRYCEYDCVDGVCVSITPTDPESADLDSPWYRNELGELKFNSSQCTAWKSMIMCAGWKYSVKQVATGTKWVFSGIHILYFVVMLMIIIIIGPLLVEFFKHRK